MKEEELEKYLPTRKQLSNKLPERHFFFGVLCTMRRQYMKDIIEESSKKRFKLSEEDEKKKAIKITDEWLEELNKYPYFSSNNVLNKFQKNLELPFS